MRSVFSCVLTCSQIIDKGKSNRDVDEEIEVSLLTPPMSLLSTPSIFPSFSLPPFLFSPLSCFRFFFATASILTSFSSER